MAHKIMTESPVYVAPDSKRVLVTSNDNTERITTVGELREQFKEESEAWKELFFESLTTINFFGYGKFAKYELLLD